MEKYNIYAGLNGGFGGAMYQCTMLCESEDEAYDIAYEMAVGEYQSYEGLHGILDWNDCFKEFCIKNNIEQTEENKLVHELEINSMYDEEIEDRISYYAILMSEDEDLSEDDYFEIN